MGGPTGSRERRWASRSAERLPVGWLFAVRSGAPKGRSGPSGGRCGELMLVEFEQVVAGGDQAPFGADRGSASSVEAVAAAVVLGRAEQGLDEELALPVE